MALVRRSGEAVELVPSDVALVRGGPDHHIAYEPSALCQEPDEFRVRHADDERSGARRTAVFLCGAYRFSGDIGRGMLDALPQMLHLPAAVDAPCTTSFPCSHASSPPQPPASRPCSIGSWTWYWCSRFARASSAATQLPAGTAIA